MRLGQKLRLRIWLVTLLSLMFWGWSTTARSEEGDVHYFQLVAGDQLCLRQFISAATKERVVKVGSCANPGISLWQRGENRTLVLVAGDETTELCLTRGEERNLYLTICYEGSNDVQSWDFNGQGDVFLFANGKRGNQLTISTHEDDEFSIELAVQGSFQWLKNDTSRERWCYLRFWDSACSRVCGGLTEEERCMPETSDDGDEKPAPEDEKPAPKDEKPKKDAGKQARWFTLKQQRLDDNICVGHQQSEEQDQFGSSSSFYQIGLQYCLPGEESQQWGHDLIRKTVYSKSLGTGFCMTRTQKDIRLVSCHKNNGINNSQRWYFSRGQESSWAALTSFVGRNWEVLLRNNTGTKGVYIVRPDYGTDCERIDGRCYELIDGLLLDSVPFYTN